MKLIFYLTLLIAVTLSAGADEYDKLCSQGAVYQEDGDVQKSIKVYQKALKIQPKGEKALTGLGKAYKLILYKASKNRKIQNAYINTIGKTGDTLELKKTVKFILRKDKRAHYAHFVLGKIQWGEGDSTGAYESFRSAYIGNRKSEEYAENLLMTIHSDKQIRRVDNFLKRKYREKNPSKEVQLLYLRGAVNKKKWTFAEKEYQKIYKKNKKWLYGNFEAIKMFHYKKKYKQASELAKIYLKKHSEHGEAREILISCYRKLNVKEKTLHREISTLVKQNPKTKKWWLELAKLDVALGDAKAALKHGKIWVERNPRSKAGYKFLLPFIAKNPEEKQTYIMVLEKLIALEPKRSSNRRKELGLIRFDEEKYAESEKLLSASAKKYPKSHDLWFKLAMSRVKLNRQGKSEAGFKKAWQLMPDSIRYAREYGRFLESDKQLKDNLRLFKLLEKNSPNITELTKIAKSYSLNNNHSAAASIWKKLSEKDPMFVKNNPMALASLAKAGHVSDVMKHSESALNNFEVNFNLGKQMEGQGNVTEALRYYNTAYKLNREHLPVILAISKIYGDQKQYSKALDGYSRALNLQPKSRDIQKKAITLAKESGHPDYLHSIYWIITAKDPGSHSVQFELGVNYFDKGNVDSAIVRWKMALKFAPKNKTYQEALNHAMSQD